MTVDVGRGISTRDDLRRIFDALEVARPDLLEALNILRVAVGLQSISAAHGAQNGRLVDTEWRVQR